MVWRLWGGLHGVGDPVPVNFGEFAHEACCEHLFTGTAAVRPEAVARSRVSRVAAVTPTLVVRDGSGLRRPDATRR